MNLLFRDYKISIRDKNLEKAESGLIFIRQKDRKYLTV